MEDLISRQWLMECVNEGWIKFDTEKDENRFIHLVRDIAPSAQPEPHVNTIDALNESIKHFDDMAEECRRNANIERNDYMDMRDDAAEYRQLSIWLNELKWLRERFQSQPEIVRCKDCKHRTSYWGNCKLLEEKYHQSVLVDGGDFCSRAERREVTK